MKKLLVLLLCLAMPISIIAQDDHSNKDEQTATPQKLSKYDKFVEQAGVFLKYQEYKIPIGIETTTRGFWDIRAKVRRIIGEEKYYLFVSVNNDITTYYAAIDYDDLLKINEAINKLLSEVEDDNKLMPEYLRNSFITDDYFCIGYYIDDDGKTKTKWFVYLDWRKKTVGVKNINDLVDVFRMGQTKIEELMLQNKK